MFARTGALPTPLQTKQELDSLDSLVETGDVNEVPYNVFIGHNLGHRVFTMSVPFRKFKDISDVANDRELGPVAQRSLDPNHAKKLASYMLKGLISAAKLKREVTDKPALEVFDNILHALGEQPYFSIQPLVCNIRNIPLGGTGNGGIRGVRLETVGGETAAFKVYLSERHTLWVVDGQHRRKGADLTMEFLEVVRATGRYPAKSAVLYPAKGTEVTEDEMVAWNEAYDAARSYATLSVEVHLGLDVTQERQLFHDLNRLGKKVDPSLAHQFDSSNPVTAFIKNRLAGDLAIQISEKEPRDWSEDTGALMLKDVVAINAIAFLNKGNISGATPAVIEPREADVLKLWERIIEIPHFGGDRAKENTVAAQPVVLKALAKITYDLNFSNRKPERASELFDKFLDGLNAIDFSHGNPVWYYYGLNPEDRKHERFNGLDKYLPPDDVANRDVGSEQAGFMRFGAKHNDIYPLLADMIRWQVKLPSRFE
ncbi:DNA sulfur modification protein DndB [Bradyrhizobium sp. OK095]|uniref:DNA sulfur modification protein DndB n=1 Tax=Bradyrhizobium sp. OK095 TaxID=1882760 RepID=UPI0008D248AB|nr:DNA sulfur modification protein DndB [Bradyrhizobium sp. OK095]SEN82125.1 DNA-sulfur modification-associated [Bradyrhizobium sp. OK095]